MRRTQSSDSVAASRNPRARSMEVSAAVTVFVIVNRGANGLMRDLRGRKGAGVLGPTAFELSGGSGWLPPD